MTVREREKVPKLPTVDHLNLHDAFSFTRPDGQEVPLVEPLDIRTIDFYLKNAERLRPDLAHFLGSHVKKFNTVEGRIVDAGDSMYVEHILSPLSIQILQDTYQKNSRNMREKVRGHVGDTGTIVEAFPAMGGVGLATQRTQMYDDYNSSSLYIARTEGTLGASTGHETKLYGMFPDRVGTASRVAFDDDVLDSGMTAAIFALARLSGQDQEDAQMVWDTIARLRKEKKAFDDPELYQLYAGGAATAFRKAGVLLNPLCWKNDPLFEGLSAQCAEYGDDPWSREQQMLLDAACPVADVQMDPTKLLSGSVGSIRLPENAWIGGGAIYNPQTKEYMGMLDVGSPIHREVIDGDGNKRILGFAQYLPEEKRGQLLAACGDNTHAIARLYDKNQALVRVKTEEGADTAIERAFAAYLTANWNEAVFS